MGNRFARLGNGFKRDKPEDEPPGTIAIYRATALLALTASAAFITAAFLRWGGYGFSRVTPAVGVNIFRYRYPNAYIGVLEFYETDTDWSGVIALVCVAAAAFFIIIAARRAQFWSRFLILPAVLLTWAAMPLASFGSRSPATYWQKYVRYATIYARRPPTPVKEPAAAAPTAALQRLVDAPQGPGMTLGHAALDVLIVAAIAVLALDYFRKKLPKLVFPVEKVVGGGLALAGLVGLVAALSPWVSQQSPWPATNPTAQPDIALSKNAFSYQTFHYPNLTAGTSQSSTYGALFALVAALVFLAGLALLFLRGRITWIVATVATLGMAVVLVLAANFPTTLLAPAAAKNPNPDPNEFTFPTRLADYGPGVMFALLATICAVVAVLVGGTIAWRAREKPPGSGGDAVLPHPVDERNAGTVGQV